MESLRSKASARKGPKPVTNKLNKNQNARKSRVDDRIKRRMSTRYATISAPTPTDAASPSVPTIPLGLRGPSLDVVRETDEVVRQQPLSREDIRAAENRLLDVENFDPDAYLKLKLANSTEAELRSLQSSLQTSKEEVAADLQRNVLKNYAQFVFISKEIGTLENEMMELKESLSEWKSMPSVLHIEESASVAERRRNVRSSVADLRVLYANQMQSLHTQIEGSAKFVPTTPGRHVIAEMDGISALNAATYKPMTAVRFVLLDDAVLVARRRRRRNASESDKLIADRCWPLNEMLVLDTKDTASLVNVFKVRHGKETHVYRTESAADKKSLLSQFRHIAEELATKKRKEREGEHERRKSLWTGGARNSIALGDVPPVPDWMADLAQQAGMSNSVKETSERDARWIGDFADQLTMAIALREWDTAVDLVEQGQAKLTTMPHLSAKLTPLTTSLTSALLQAISYPHNHKEAVKKLIFLLVRLDAGAAARKAFLSARTETARRLVRMIRFDGHIGTYISELAIAIFTVIKHTADWFLASFKENEAASSFIEWAKSQIETFAEMFRIQVFSTDVDKAVVDEALSITHNQSRKLLQDFGLDFRFILDALLVPNPPENVPPPVPILAPAPSSSVLASKAPGLPPRTARNTAPATEQAPESSPTPPPGPAADFPTRSGRSTPAAAPPTPPTDSPLRTARTAPVPSPVASVAMLVQRSNSPSTQQSQSPMLSASLGRRARSPYPPPAAPNPSRPSTPSLLTSRGTSSASASTVSLVPPSAPTQPALASPIPLRAGLPSPAPTPPRGGGALPLSTRGANPAPPPRSRERPGSAAGRERERPPPVSVPRREGYF